MRPVGHAAGIGRGRHAAEDLHREPKAQHDPGRDREDAEEDDEEERRYRPAPWETAADSRPSPPQSPPRRRPSGSASSGSASDLQPAGGKARGKVEEKEGQMAHLVFQVVAEDPQEQHVARKVHPAAVQEHRGQKSVQIMPLGHIRAGTRPQSSVEAAPAHVRSAGTASRPERPAMLIAISAPGDIGRAPEGL